MANAATNDDTFDAAETVELASDNHLLHDLPQIVSVATQDSILRNVLQRIQHPNHRSLQLSIAPFQASSQQSPLERREGSDNKHRSFDLEEYLKRQAALAQRKRKPKKKVPKLHRNDNYSVSERSKLRPTDTSISDESRSSESEYVPSDEIDSDTQRVTSSKRRKTPANSILERTKKTPDDGDDRVFERRMDANSYPGDEAMHKLDNLFKVPQSIWKRLYSYQRIAVQWLWRLHGRKLGGLMGDEMGLGKTVQIIAFLAGLDCSELLSYDGRFRGLGPSVVVCPATLMEQWVKHFHEWWPFFRVVVLHNSGGYIGDPVNLIESLRTGGILVTSYNGVLKHKDLLVSNRWHYVILDEGHKIRNPEAKVSRAVKRFQTPHRLLLTGSPMQNSLKELWSLFDFILPGKLGTLPVFLQHCAGPITRGGYTNATPLQEATALQIATMLKDTITPYMLRRTWTDVMRHLALPEKNEQVLFCSLTDEQKKLYKTYLCSEDVSFVLHEKNNHRDNGRYRARFLVALSALRKICNHPDLFLYTRQLDSDEDIDVSEESLDDAFGHWKRAGKMTVVRSLLKIWRKQGHRVLLFSQGRQMMHILESLLQRESYTYLRLDGTTAVSQRQTTIQTFNNDPSYFIFLLTTRVGGLGVNLTGASRVIIYDPDWNPATDAQARARAWRIGQDKRVTIYRLITAGTIEEKMYHRQVFKILLSSKVLDEPRQRRLFKTSDLVELFNLNEPINGDSSESDRLFGESKLTPITGGFSLSKIEKMRKLASALSKRIGAMAAATESARDKDKRANCVTCEPVNDEPSNNTRCDEVAADQYLSEDEISSQDDNTQRVRSECNGDSRSNSDTNVEMNNTERHHALRNDSERDAISIGSANEDFTMKNEASDDRAESLSVRKRKRSKRGIRGSKEASISAMFEGERVSCLIGRRLGCSDEKGESVSTTDDDYVLKKLLAKSSVSSAFRHEAVLSNARDTNGCNENAMQRFARETAQESMDFVRQSGKFC